MPNTVVNGASMQCSQGVAPATLTVLPTCMCASAEQPTATVNDYVPMVNIAPFGMCQSPANPQVAAATAAAMGVLTPQPCIPVVTAPWSPGSSDVSFNDAAALTDNSTCNCQWAGTIQIVSAGQQDVTIG